MSKLLNVSIIQMPLGDNASSLKYLRDSVDILMQSYAKPELVVGVEFGIGCTPDTIPGKTTEFLGAIAKKHGIYFIPGTMFEISGEEGKFYNSCPVFGPDGRLITSYRKKVPFQPLEDTVVASKDPGYCTFRIPEKDITVGVLICYDQFFPEIPRTLALEGAELLLCPAADPVEFRHIPGIIPRARALENELYYIWTSNAGLNAEGTGCGGSIIVDPEGAVVFQCGDTPTMITKTLDLSRVALKRSCGADQHLSSLKYFDVKSPYANRTADAPVYASLPELTHTPAQWIARQEEYEMPLLSTSSDPSADQELDELYKQYLKIM